MKVLDLLLELLREAPWNPNRMDDAMLAYLTESVRRYGLARPVVARRLPDGTLEVVDGHQLIDASRKLGYRSVPCVVLELNDIEARLLSQALNRIHGEDDLGLKAELIKELLERLSPEEVLAVLPETADSLKALASLGKDTIARQLQAWQKAQEARLRHLQFHLLPSQLEIVEEALAKLLPKAREVQGESPNARSTALYLICKAILEKEWYK